MSGNGYTQMCWWTCSLMKREIISETVLVLTIVTVDVMYIGTNEWTELWYLVRPNNVIKMHPTVSFTWIPHLVSISYMLVDLYFSGNVSSTVE